MGGDDSSVSLVESRHETWRTVFETERDRIREAVVAHDREDALTRIEHVGSTAVPELAAKPVVDVACVVSTGNASNERSETADRGEPDGPRRAVAAVARAVASLGGERGVNDARWEHVDRAGDTRRFVHVFAESHDGWKRQVATRAVLRARPALRDRYERRKRELAARADDVDDYTESKRPILRRLLREARESDDLQFDFRVPAEL